MIKTSKQLKDLIHNQAKGDSGKTQLLFRNYAMERFLERISQSRYKNNFILKGGFLISAIVGVDNRATMDMDTTVRNLPLHIEQTKQMIEEIAALNVDDSVFFEIKDISTIMNDAKYEGIRISLIAYLDKSRIPLKIDLSTGDVITPSEISYQYQLMFEQRTISINVYPLETILAEKIETVLIRTIFNTRMRDFYDLRILQEIDTEINMAMLGAALQATYKKRNTEQVLSEYHRILDEISSSLVLEESWKKFQNKNSYAERFTWTEIMNSIRSLCDRCIPQH